eukprot:jgi/Ulvmu1/778/UM010_0152.1
MAQVSESEAEAILEEELIELTKAWVDTFNSVSEEQAAAVSEHFVFRGPVVGPLTKEQYTYVLNGFKIHEALPDVETKAFGFSVDPQVRPQPSLRKLKASRHHVTLEASVL